MGRHWRSARTEPEMIHWAEYLILHVVRWAILSAAAVTGFVIVSYWVG